MIIGNRLLVLRKEKGHSQGDIEKRTGLLRCYISRVENGHTVPSIETLEKIARALDLPLHRLFYDGEQPPLVNLPKRVTPREVLWGESGKDSKILAEFRRYLSRSKERDRKLLLFLAQKMTTA